MLIRVMYRDGKYDLVKDIILDRLIESNKIMKFYRSGRWAIIGRDPVRVLEANSTGYKRRRYDH